MLVFAFALTAPAFADPSPSPSPSASHAVTVPATKAQDFWEAVAAKGRSADAENLKLSTALKQLLTSYQAYGLSVYAPYCAKLGGVQGVQLAQNSTAWPATVWCNDMPAKSKGLTAAGPTP
jgi:hypothetical protein